MLPGCLLNSYNFGLYMGNMSRIILPSNVLVDILQDLIESVLLLMLEICSNVILDLKIVLEGIKRIDIKD